MWPARQVIGDGRGRAEARGGCATAPGGQEGSRARDLDLCCTGGDTEFRLVFEVQDEGEDARGGWGEM